MGAVRPPVDSVPVDSVHYIELGALTPRMSRPMARADTCRLDEPQARLGEIASDRLGQHRAVVVEAVEGARQGSDPRRDLVGGPVPARLGDHVGQLLEAAQQLELPVVDQQGEVHVRDRAPLDAPLGPDTLDRGDPGVRVYCT